MAWIRSEGNRNKKGLARNLDGQRKPNQSNEEISAISVFLACSFRNKKIKKHFDNLKKTWEETLAIKVYLSDRVKGGGARDLWREIQEKIKEANLAIFDLTTFRPNVVLELGYAIALKQETQVVICFDLTPTGKKRKTKPMWLLSDIGQLHRIEYKTFKQLDDQLGHHRDRMAPVKNFYKLAAYAERTMKSKKNRRVFISEALGFLKKLRDDGPISHKEFRTQMRRHGIAPKDLGDCIKRNNLAKRISNKRSDWILID